jgi:arsenate reductase
MQEVGIDLAGQKPKPVGDVPLGGIDTVITVCAEEVCALPPGGLVQHHWALEDPTVVDGTDDEILAAFRKTREEIRGRLEALLEQSR